ncbi:hypothetical protein BGE01nite_53840 [Brevifollis gellanilyticus]|uniref:Uncharacterized protein n=1 Tax=Brevifollis gellanilyticus TaxID=748831 RepID=A0A512MH78_9BACT|nr:hypothetical protein BGE01nite_53840 [Brevifollis gellanilyticus]
MAEEGDLEAEAFALGAVEMTGEIPPLRAELGMAGVIARKSELSVRLREGEAVGSGGLGKECGGEENEEEWECSKWVILEETRAPRESARGLAHSRTLPRLP